MSQAKNTIAFTEYDLPNGLHVILSPSQDQPIVGVNLWYYVGSKDEDPNRTGFAHLFEHLMFEGSANVKKSDHFKFVQGAGGTLNASTSFDRTNYFETLPANQLELALWLESDRMLSLDVSERNFENQRNVVKEERKQRYDNKPYGRTFETILRNIYTDSGYKWSTIGSMEHLNEATLEEVQAFHKKWYAPNNASLAISGDFDIDRTSALIESYFGSIPSLPSIERPTQIVTPLQSRADVEIEDAVSLTSITLAFQSATIYSRDDHALDVLADLLTRGRSSRLYKSLIYDQQLAKSVGAYNLAFDKSGVFILEAICQNGIEPEKLENALCSELAKVFAEGIQSEELERAKNRLQMRHANSLQVLSNRNDNLQQAFTYRKDTNLVNTEMDKLQSIDIPSVHSLSQYFDQDHCVVLKTVPKK
ncbi:MAG: pitrilysin family protein [bacterium]